MPDTVTTYGIFKSHSLFYTKIFVIDTNEYLSVRLASEIGIEVKGVDICSYFEEGLYEVKRFNK